MKIWKGPHFHKNLWWFYDI